MVDTKTLTDLLETFLIGATTVGAAGGLALAVVYLASPRQAKEVEEKKQRLYNLFETVPADQRPQVIELLKELQNQDKKSIAGYRIGHLLKRYNDTPPSH